jgi:hypothetical protein
MNFPLLETLPSPSESQFIARWAREKRHLGFRHRVETYRDVTDRCKHCGRLRFHVPTFFQATGRKMINCACSASLKLVVIRSSSNQMHASSNLPSVRTKKVGTLVTSLYVSTLCFRQVWACLSAVSVPVLLQFTGRDGLGYPASAPNFTVGLRVENNNKFSRQFLQVTFEMLQMSQEVRSTFLLRWNQVYCRALSACVTLQCQW